jgi:hypothetical protein
MIPAEHTDTALRWQNFKDNRGSAEMPGDG